MKRQEELIKYIEKHCERGACQCGHCIDAVDNPEEHQPTGHTADLVFFEVRAVGDPSAEELRGLISEEGEFTDVDLFDGEEHSYMEVGGWIGSQNYALMLMGLGSLLGLWKLLTPKNMLGSLISVEMAMQMAATGMVTIKAEKDEPAGS